MYISVILIISCVLFSSHAHTRSIMLYLAAWVYIVSPWEHLKTKKEYWLAERKVMNISPHLVLLRITEERDYAAYRLDSKNTNVLYAKPLTWIFSLTVVMQLVLLVRMLSEVSSFCASHISALRVIPYCCRAVEAQLIHSYSPSSLSRQTYPIYSQ